MVFVVGTMGFFAGIALGILILKGLLRDRSTEELLENRVLKWTYGLMAWVIAGITSYASVEVYQLYIVPLFTGS